MVASSQPLASEIGLSILKKGGNAIDAAIATAAALNVTEPCSTGLGGDCFILQQRADDKKVQGLNGSGQAPSNLTVDTVLNESAVQVQGEMEIDDTHANSVTVPGTAHCWMSAVERFGSGRLVFSELMQPAADLAAEGWPCANVTSHLWANGRALLVRDGRNNAHELLMPDGSAPGPGEVVKNPTLSQTLRDLGQCGDKGAKIGHHEFMNCRVGHAIVYAVEKQGGHMTLEDLTSFESEIVEPISIEYCKMKIYEIPPNGQGLTALLAFNLLNEIEQQYNLKFGNEENDIKQGSELQFHILIEVLRLAFIDSRYQVEDPKFCKVPVSDLLSQKQANQRIINQFSLEKAIVDVTTGSPVSESNTVSFQVIDKLGNAVSMVNSNQKGFGSGIIPSGCGFTLQNRGNNFSLNPGHPNCLLPRKRPQHTIIPCLVTHQDSGDLFCSLTNMGAFMQPQGQLQLLVAMIKYKMNPQEAIDQPRFCILDGRGNNEIVLEEGISESVRDGLLKRGHRIRNEGVDEGYSGHEWFGRAQAIFRDKDTGVLIGGSDGRSDGCAMGY